jgi:hypothetical protein
MAKRPKQKLTKMEKLEREIRLATLKQERALKAIEKGRRDLMAGAKALAKGHAARRRLEAKVANKLTRPEPEPIPVEIAIAVEPPAIPIAQIGETEAGQANAATWDTIPAVADAKARKRERDRARRARKRDAKAGPTLSESCDALVSALIQAPAAPAREAREARLESLGFRRTSRRK